MGSVGLCLVQCPAPASVSTTNAVPNERRGCANLYRPEEMGASSQMALSDQEKFVTPCSNRMLSLATFAVIDVGFGQDEVHEHIVG